MTIKNAVTFSYVHLENLTMQARGRFEPSNYTIKTAYYAFEQCS